MKNRLTIVSAKDPVRREDSYTEIFMRVWFEEFDHPINFCATSYDCEPHGRELWFRAMKGEYGEVLVAPKPAPTIELEPVVKLLPPPMRMLAYDDHR